MRKSILKAVLAMAVVSTMATGAIAADAPLTLSGSGVSAGTFLGIDGHRNGLGGVSIGYKAYSIDMYGGANKQFGGDLQISVAEALTGAPHAFGGFDMYVEGGLSSHTGTPRASDGNALSTAGGAKDISGFGTAKSVEAGGLATAGSNGPASRVVTGSYGLGLSYRLDMPKDCGFSALKFEVGATKLADQNQLGVKSGLKFVF